MSMSYKRIVAVVDSDILESLEASWTKLPKELVKLNSLLHVPKNINGNIDKDGKLNSFMDQDTFLEFVEKLNILEQL